MKWEANNCVPSGKRDFFVTRNSTNFLTGGTPALAK